MIQNKKLLLSSLICLFLLSCKPNEKHGDQGQEDQGQTAQRQEDQEQNVASDDGINESSEVDPKILAEERARVRNELGIKDKEPEEGDKANLVGFRTKCVGFSSASIPYYVTASFNTSYGAALKIARSQLDSFSPIRLKYDTSRTRKFLAFATTTQFSGGYTDCFGNYVVVYLGGIQSKTDTVKAGFILHETLHALGFAHEQQRSDRDNYVIANITSFKEQSAKIGPSNCNGGFDFDSILFNFRNFFTRRTDVAWKGYGVENTSDKTLLSFADIAGLYRKYGGMPGLSCFPPAYPKTVTITQDATNVNVAITRRDTSSKGVLVFHKLVKPTTCEDVASDMIFDAETKTLSIPKTQLVKGSTYHLGVCPYSVLGKTNYRPRVQTYTFVPN